MTEDESAPQSTYRESLDRAMMGVLLANCAKPEAFEPENFAHTLDWAVRVLSEEHLRNHFGISRATVGRWTTGQTIPGPLARSGIQRHLTEFLEQTIAL